MTGLTAADFVVREDNTAREVLSAGPATEPLTIAVTVDDSQAATRAIQFIRDGLDAFFKKLDGKAQIALSTYGERPTPLVEYTDSTAQLQKGIGRLFSRSGAGAYLLEALVELSRGIEKREAKRPVIVVVAVESESEFSNLYYTKVLDALKRSGATLHVLSIGTPARVRHRRDAQPQHDHRRGNIADRRPPRSGPGRERALRPHGAARRRADATSTSCRYSRPEQLIPPEKIDVSVTKSGLTVRAPKRLPTR